MATIFLTGHRGYLGSTLMESLERSRKHRVSTLDGRLADLETSIDADTVIHAAGVLRNRPTEIQASNVDGTERLLSFIRPNTHAIFLSSRAVYGVHSPVLRVRETDPLQPIDEYGESKVAGEVLVRSAANFTILRTSILYGISPQGPGLSFINRMVQTALSCGLIPVKGGEQLVDPTPVQRLSSIILSICEAEPANDVFNVAGPPISISRWASFLASAVEERTAASCRPVHEGIAGPGVVLDTSKLASHFGLGIDIDSSFSTARSVVDHFARSLAQPKQGQST